MLLVCSLNIWILVTDKNLATGTVIKQDKNNTKISSQGLLKACLLNLAIKVAHFYLKSLFND